MRAIAFDLDGVLVDTYLVWWRVLNATLEEFGGRPIDEPSFRPHWGQGIEDDLRVWFPGKTKAEVSAAYARHFPKFLADVRAIPGALDVVKRVREAGKLTAVVTNSPCEVASGLLRHAGFTNEFDTVVTAGDVARPKPAPDMVVMATERLGVGVGEVVLVGDTENDRRAAEAAKSGFIMFVGSWIDITPQLIA